MAAYQERNMLRHFLRGMDLTSLPPCNIPPLQQAEFGERALLMRSKPVPNIVDSQAELLFPQAGSYHLPDSRTKHAKPSDVSDNSRKRETDGDKDDDARHILATSPSAIRMRGYVQIPALPVKMAPARLRGDISNIYEIPVQELGDTLIQTITGLVNRNPTCMNSGYFKVKVDRQASEDVFTPELAGTTIDRNKSILTRFVNTSFEMYELAPAQVRKPFEREHLLQAHASVEEVHTFTFPSFDHTVDNIPAAELPAYFSTCIKSKRPSSKFSYLIAPADAEDERARIGLPPEQSLDCGDRLRKTRFNAIPGVHTSWGYVSTASGSFAAVHIEDAGMGSINLVHRGQPKLWLIVAPHHATKLEHEIGQLFPHLLKRKCSQWVRHANLILLPELLDRWGVEYTVVRCEAGEMVVTLPNAYHQVWNEGTNVAEALNFVLDDWTPPDGYAYSSGYKKPCGCTITKADLDFREDSEE